MPPRVVSQWEHEVKPRLQQGLWSPKNLKPLGNGRYRLRLAGEYRVILRYARANCYEAEAIDHRKDVYRGLGR